MSLSDKLKVAEQESANKLCKLGILLSGTKISEAEKKSLKSILDSDPNDPSRVPNSTLGQILREEGYDISNSVIDRHRRTPQSCGCGRLAGRKK